MVYFGWLAIGLVFGILIGAAQSGRWLYRCRREQYRLRDLVQSERFQHRDIRAALERLVAAGGLNVYEEGDIGSGIWRADPYRPRYMRGAGPTPIRAILSVCPAPVVEAD